MSCHEIKAKLEDLREEGIVIIDKPYQAKNFSQYGIDPDVILPDIERIRIKAIRSTR